jgi:hypothetical protein
LYFVNSKNNLKGVSMSDRKVPLWKNAGRFAVAAGILATLVTALAVTKTKNKVHSVRPTWDDRYEEDSLGI